ncbi:MAG: ABC transporter ATP-binding protein [Acidobacteriota bacterium]
MKDTVLNVRDFSKRYGDFAAVGGISFELHRGEIFGLLGPNGAGKTTTLECLEGLRRPDQGKMDILGIDPSRDARKLRQLIGVQLQTSALPASMQVDEAMQFFSAYHGVAPRYDLLERMGLGEKRRTQYRELSVGLQRRLALALAVAHRPPVLFLDEPTAGLDVGSRTELHALMEELKREETSILLATHDMAEAEKLSDRVAILLKGKIVATGTPRDLTAKGSGDTKVSVRTEHAILSKNGVSFPAVSRRMLTDDYATFFSTDPGPTVSAILAYLAAQNDKLIDLRVERPSLEERFLEITHNGGAK